MEYIKKFKKEEKEKKAILKSMERTILEFLKESSIDGFNIKYTQNFSWKVRFDEINTKRNLYHFFIESNLHYPNSRILKFEDFHLFDSYTPVLNFTFDNFLINDEVSIEKINEFNHKKVILESKLDILNAKLIKLIKEYLAHLKSQSKYYLNYYTESKYGFNEDTFKDFLNEHNFIDGFTPFLSSVEKQIGTRIWETKTYSSFMMIKIKEDVVLFDNVLPINSYDYKIITLEHNEKSIPIKEIFDIYSKNRIDELKINFNQTIKNIYKKAIRKETLSKNKEIFTINNQFENTYYLLKNYFIGLFSELKYHYTTTGWQDSMKNRNIFNDHRIEVKFPKGSSYDFYLINDFNEIKWEKKNIFELVQYNCLFYTIFNFLKTYHVDLIKNMADYYWGLDYCDYQGNDKNLLKIYHPKLYQ